MITLVFDTETSGLPDFKAPHWDESQPNVIQFGMTVYDERYPVFELGVLLNHEGVSIEAGAEAIHGISSAMTSKHGWGWDYFFKEFHSWLDSADRIVAHNAAFDVKMMKTFYHRHTKNMLSFPEKQIICTMHSTTRICRIPQPSGRGGNKWPKLSEAYEKLIDPAGFGGAHNALADVNACARLLFWLEDNDMPLYNEKNQPI